MVATDRLEQARSRLTYAQVAFDDDQFDVAAELAVTAGINGSDAICCVALGHHARGEDHREAVRLLRGASREAANALERLLEVKSVASYGDRIGGQKARSALRSARRLLDLAESHLGM